jgi:hypothetical protein
MLCLTHKISDRLGARLGYLLETVALEAPPLAQTNQRLFATPFDAARTGALRHTIEDSERTDALESAEQWLAIRKLRNRMGDYVARRTVRPSP